MVAFPRLALGAVHNISERNIFFTPLEKDHLDLETVSTAPPSHRGVLQRNGLLAKMCVGVTFYEEQGVDDNDRSGLAEHQKLSRARQESLWRSALVYAGFLKKDDGLVIPPELVERPWPVHTAPQYTKLMKEMRARQACSTANTSEFCVPILSIDEFPHQHMGVRVWLGVAWMPRYSHNLRQWATTFLHAKQPIPEASLMTCLHHMATGALVLRRATNTAGKIDATLSLDFTLDKVLVHRASRQEEDGGETDLDQVEGGLTFVLAAGVCKWPQCESHEDKSGATSETARFCTGGVVDYMHALKREQLMYRSPEDCWPHVYPTHVNGGAKRDVWRLGIMLYLLASGVAATPNACIASPCGRHTRPAGARELAPLSAIESTPDSLWKRLRRDLECRAYSSAIVTVVTQLLSLDPMTRPSLTTVDCMLQDLQRLTPVRRFPFALGSYDLLRMPNPTDIELDPIARRYTLVGVCMLCKKPRDSTPLCTKGGEHVPGASSPLWSDEELLPQLITTDTHYMTFLYPLCGSRDERQRRKQMALALQSSLGSGSSALACEGAPPLDISVLFQVFGGFAVYKRVPERNEKGQTFHRITMKEVLVLYPSQGLRRSEWALRKMTIDFSGGLPWPSSCTESLQASGRVSRNVPLAFTGAHHDVEWFAWVLPGERFSLPNGGHWTAPRDGAFVFWFNSDLQPTDRDRYFALTSVRAATLPAKVPRTVMPDSLLRLHAGDERHITSPPEGYIQAGSRFETRQGRLGVIRANNVHRRTCHNVADVALPSATHEILELTESKRIASAQSPLSPLPAQLQNIQESPANWRCHRGMEKQQKRTKISHCSTLPVVAVVDSLKTTGEVQKGSGAACAPSTPHTTANTANRCASATPQLYDRDLFSKTPSSATPISTGCKSSESPDWDTASKHTAMMVSTTTQRPLRRPSTVDSARALGLPGESAYSAAQHSLGPACRRERKTGSITPSSRDERGTNSQSFSGSVPVRSGAVQGATSVPAFVKPLSFLHGSDREPSTLVLEQSPVSHCKAMRRGVRESAAVTPRLPPVGGALPRALGEIHVCGLWLSGTGVDAVFRALTFCVLSTGEHGYIHPPVKISAQTARAIRAPQGAAFVAFLSNQVPLLRRNHPQLNTPQLPLILPHHGFACYAGDGTLVGILALRCSTTAARGARGDEFELMLHVTPARHGSSVSPRVIYASYLAGGLEQRAHTTQAAIDRGKARGEHDEKRQTSPLCHVSSSLHPFSGSCNVSCDIAENETLTLTSACDLVRNFTPNDNGQGLSWQTGNSAPVLPACWMGFDGAVLALLFTDAEQSEWVPYHLGR
ncbi:hypothetical protein JKF63_03239 [Porcisia hertigi]|uniref:Protein kinase domain-containing protein n=1 Tax=Porcisia hertigi TaxID=2761500 RepID=A0A836L753_9TRYP|nr:hypothetical protein JKF63_03239 [Porcisia hertigi]